MSLRRHPMRLVLIALLFLASFGLGLRWGLYLPLTPSDDVRLVTYAEISGSQDPALAPASAVLFRDSHFAVQTRSFGYLGLTLDSAAVQDTFAALNNVAPHWVAHYPAATSADSTAAILRLTLASGATRTIRIDTPGNNLDVPRSLRSFLGVLHRWQFTTIATGHPVDRTHLRLIAVPIVPVNAETIIYDVPADYLFVPLTAPGGAAVTTDDELVRNWYLADSLLGPANERVVRTTDQHLYKLVTLIDWEFFLH